MSDGFLLSKTMQQLMFVSPRQFEWREVLAPRIAAAGEAIVRPLAVTRCDLDLYLALGAFPMPGEFAFGHEIAGEVLEVGGDVANVKPGDRVIVPFQISCGACRFCNAGLTNACSSVPAYSAYGLAHSSGREWGGGLSDAVLVPYADAMLVKIPPSLSLTAAAALSDNAVDGFRTVAKRLQATPGAPVLVVGGLAQSVGLFAVQAALSLGSERVVYCDNSGARLALARSLGAEIIDCDFAEVRRLDERFPIVVDAAISAEGLTFALRNTQACGHCVSVSSTPGGGEIGAPVPFREMYMKGVSWEVSRVHARGALHDALECTSCGLDPDKIITRELPFEAAHEVMCDDAIKLVFTR